MTFNPRQIHAYQEWQAEVEKLQNALRDIITVDNRSDQSKMAKQALK